MCENLDLSNMNPKMFYEPNNARMGSLQTHHTKP